MKGQNAKPIPSELYNASKGGYVTSAEQVKDYRIGQDQEQVNANTYRKSETYNKQEVDNLIATHKTKYISVTATPETTSVEELLPAVGEVDTVYRVGCWDGEKYDPHKRAEYGWSGSEYVLLGVDDFGIDNEPTPGSSNTVMSGGVAAVEGYYEENPEYMRVYLDSNDRIIKGIKKDGTEYFAAGIETDASETTVVENPEYFKVYIDNGGHILWALSKTGDVIYGAGVPTQIVEYIEEVVKPFKELLHYEDNPEFIDVKLDADDRILEATRNNGNKYFPATVENDAAEISTEANPEYLSTTIDAGGKLINSIDRETENIRYGGINLSEIKRDLDAQVLEVHMADDNTYDIYTIENNDSTISLEIDDDWNILSVIDSESSYDLSMEDNGDVYLEENIN